MQILLGILVVIVLIAIFAAQFEKISHQQKMHILKIAAIIFALAWLYQSMVTSQAQNKRQKVNAFKQGKTLICHDAPVNEAFFYYESGTESFVTNEKNSSLNGVIYAITDCKIKQ